MLQQMINFIENLEIGSKKFAILQEAAVIMHSHILDYSKHKFKLYISKFFSAKSVLKKISNYIRGNFELEVPKIYSVNYHLFLILHIHFCLQCWPVVEHQITNPRVCSSSLGLSLGLLFNLVVIEEQILDTHIQNFTGYNLISSLVAH